MSEAEGNDNFPLTGEDLVRIVEALDAYIPRDSYKMAPSDRQDWRPYESLRGRLQNSLGMNLGDTARGWTRSVLMCEREAMADALAKKMFDLMDEPQMTRRQFRDQMGKAIRECRTFQFFLEGKSVTVSHHHGVTRTLKL